MGGGGSVVMEGSLLVKPEVARKQLDDETPTPGPVGVGGASGNGSGVTAGGNGTTPGGATGGGTPVAERLPKRFYGSVPLDPIRVGRYAGRIAEEVLTHLAALPGSRLRVSIEIEADMPEGAPENVQRTVSENARVLKFETQGFEIE